MFTLLLGLLAQGQALELTSSLDRARLAVGEELVFTLRAVGHSTAPFRVELPAFDGFAIIERTERTDVVVGTGQTTRAYTLELRLRAEQVGTWTILPIRVEQGEASAFSAPESVSVGSASSSVSSGLDAGLLALMPRVPPPRIGTPSIFTVLSDDRVFAGDQLSVLTAAWLPRSLRMRLRQPPTLTPPSLAGVWVTPPQAVPGAVASRVVEEEVYDLYVSLQTVYPLNPGQLTVPPARLAWVQPASRQSTGAERRESAESRPVSLSVLPLPANGRPGGFDGPVARDVRIGYALGASSARAGAALRVELVVSGTGNLSLWPPPKVAWPPSVRVYQEGTEDALRTQGLRLGGTKRFRFGIVPDSAGSLSLPALEYAYFDPVASSYRVARAPSIVVPVLEAAPVADRRDPLPIEEPESQPFADRLWSLPGPVRTALVVAPLLLVLGLALWRRRVPAPRQRPVRPSAGSRLDALVKALVPPGTPAAPRALAGALRGAGVPRGEAERLVRLHLALEAERFSRDARDAESPSLAKEIEAVLGALPRKLRPAHLAVLLGALLSAAGLPNRAVAQSGLELYSRGDYAAAAHAFRSEAETSPPSAARWYDLAAAEYLARRDAHAVAALLPARAHAPRDPLVQNLWNALAREHEQLRRSGRLWLLSAEECFALALLGLWLGAVLFAAFRQRRWPWAVAFSVALAFAIAGQALRAERKDPRAVTAGGVSLRTSPHGLAPERGTLPGFSVVRLERALGSWWLIRTSSGALGWVPAEILARSPALD